MKRNAMDANALSKEVNVNGTENSSLSPRDLNATSSKLARTLVPNVNVASGLKCAMV